MSSRISLMENYEEYVRRFGKWHVQIIAYVLADKYICIVNNIDPSATICRISAPTRSDALKKAMAETNVRLSSTVMSDVPVRQAPAANLELIRLDFDNEGATISYEVPAFLELPMGDRMKMILSGNLAFIGSDQSLVPSDVAMRLLGKAASA